MWVDASVWCSRCALHRGFLRDACLLSGFIPILVGQFAPAWPESLGSAARPTRSWTKFPRLRKQVKEQSKKAGRHGAKNSTLVNDEMASGQLAVGGEGIILTLANPIAAGSDGTVQRHAKVSAAADFAWLPMPIFSCWSTAVAGGRGGNSLNDKRLGAQTSIRKAGINILVGVTAVTSPYTIQAIGDSDTLASAVSSPRSAVCMIRSTRLE